MHTEQDVWQNERSFKGENNWAYEEKKANMLLEQIK